jgi:hypothetical protein
MMGDPRTRRETDGLFLPDSAWAGPLQMRQVLLDRAIDGGIARIGEQAKRVPEAKGGLQRAGADVQPPRLGIRAPPPRPQGAEVAASAPQSGGPLAEVEVPEWVVDPGRLPVDDAGQSAAIGQQLTIVNVAVDQDRTQLGGAGQQVRPYRGTSRPAQKIRRFSSRGGAGSRVQSPPQPAMMSGVGMTRRARPGQRTEAAVDEPPGSSRSSSGCRRRPRS